MRKKAGHRPKNTARLGQQEYFLAKIAREFPMEFPPTRELEEIIEKFTVFALQRDYLLTMAWMIVGAYVVPFDANPYGPLVSKRGRARAAAILREAEEITWWINESVFGGISVNLDQQAHMSESEVAESDQLAEAFPRLPKALRYCAVALETVDPLLDEECSRKGRPRIAAIGMEEFLRIFTIIHPPPEYVSRFSNPV
jgi:hypothetical protein